MADKAKTVTVASTAADVTMPLAPDEDVAAINIGDNNIWVSHEIDGTATVEGDECEVIPPGQATLLHWRDTRYPYSMIAETGDTKLNLVNRLGRG